jgi:ribosomal protein S18 acetylase RimI-like enzyme
MTSILIERGFAEADRTAMVALLREYEAGLGVSLCFQGFAAELTGLPGDYAPPGGALLVARAVARGEGAEPTHDPDTAGNRAPLVGMVALRPVEDGRSALCEMKRLYVRAEARGCGLGRRLALAIMAEAAGLGYRRICLDTLPEMRAAQSLYRSLGFRQTGISNSEPSVLLFERELERR